jgi:hypothetical protein
MPCCPLLLRVARPRPERIQQEVTHSRASAVAEQQGASLAVVQLHFTCNRLLPGQVCVQCASMYALP